MYIVMKDGVLQQNIPLPVLKGSYCTIKISKGLSLIYCFRYDALLYSTIHTVIFNGVNYKDYCEIKIDDHLIDIISVQDKRVYAICTNRVYDITYPSHPCVILEFGCRLERYNYQSGYIAGWRILEKRFGAWHQVYFNKPFSAMIIRDTLYLIGMFGDQEGWYEIHDRLVHWHPCDKSLLSMRSEILHRVYYSNTEEERRLWHIFETNDGFVPVIYDDKTLIIGSNNHQVTYSNVTRVVLAGAQHLLFIDQNLNAKEFNAQTMEVTTIASNIGGIILDVPVFIMLDNELIAYSSGDIVSCGTDINITNIDVVILPDANYIMTFPRVNLPLHV